MAKNGAKPRVYRVLVVRLKCQVRHGITSVRYRQHKLVRLQEAMLTIPSQAYAVAEAPRRKRWTGQLYIQVLIAIVLGAALGHFYPTYGAALKPLGDAFIKLVKMIIAPVIFLTLVTGIAGMKELGSVGRVAG